MCGIFGVINATAQLDASSLAALTRTLLLASRTRGSEAAGVARWDDQEVTIFKTDEHPKAFVRQSRFWEVVTPSAERDDLSRVVTFGHTRMVTNGSAIFDENNQPATAGPVTLVHNGIVTNFADLDGADPQGESDTAALARHLALRFDGGTSSDEVVATMFGAINGSASLAIADVVRDQLILATNTGSLYLASRRDGRPVLFASELGILTSVLNKGRRRGLGALEITGMSPDSGLAVDRQTGAARAFRLHSYVAGQDRFYRGLSSVRSADPPTRADVGDDPPRWSAAADQARRFAATVRRCQRCIMPTTMPFLELDNEGVCNHCRDHRPIEVRPAAELQERLDELGDKLEGPQCILAFSGGRDSAWGLHLLVREYGIRPITLTYDWGMVTDLARRNQARMNGALGVEQVLVSADIAHKRSNIGRNLRAWMRRPELGMIPLLMAGDKQFFLHTHRLSKQLGLPMVIYCINPREATYFKAGFAGVPSQRYYDSATISSRLRLLAYYAGQYLRNPSYVNRSLIDTVQAVWATYFRPHDYLQMFQWVDWDEDEINATLTSEYGWETDPTTPTTWRIGDGTAPFYNYVYWRCVGFSEIDTFRSNQVREGTISRERALELAAVENEPRWSRIREYLDLVGVDFDEAMEAVERLATMSQEGASRRS